MAEQMRPASDEQAPDPAHSYERTDPEREAGMGRMDSERTRPAKRADHIKETVKNQQTSDRQINAHDVVNQRAGQSGTGATSQPDHSMLDEEPLGSDQSPSNPVPPQEKRNPRTGGKGGTPDVGEPSRKG